MEIQKSGGMFQITEGYLGSPSPVIAGFDVMEFLSLDKGRQGRLLGYLKALTEMQQDKS